jgi:D-glycero-D-manno-heptose 1,7-bisphosphate phosphatase
MGVIRKKVKRAVFLDRDGVLTLSLIRDGKGYAPTTLGEFEILPEAREACQLLKKEGFLLVVVTNQPDVGRGILSLGILEEMHRRLRGQLPLDDILVCTDPSEAPGPRRKPAPGMLLEAAVTWDLDLTRSYMVGDRKVDIDAGRAAGCRCIFIDRGYQEAKPLEPNVIVGNVLEGARWVLHNKELPS